MFYTSVRGLVFFFFVHILNSQRRLVAAFSGPIFDAFGPRYMIPLSGLVTVFSLCMLSVVQAHHIYQQFLCQSVLFNAGAVFGYICLI